MNSGGTSGHTEEPFASKEHSNVCQYLQPNSTCRRDRKDTARSRSRIRHSDHCIAPAFAAAGSQQVAAAFEPSWFVQGITGLFALATLATGALALANIGHPILVDTATFTRVDNDEQVSAPNVRGWGVRQITTGATLWAALLLGDEVLFQVGLGSVVIRQCLDIVANLLDRRPLGAAPYIALAVPTIAALLQVL